MIYLDYSATTPVSNHVLEENMRFHKHYFANPNSIHQLGLTSFKASEETTALILKDLNLEHHQLVYTSGATESNNMAIKGVCLKHQSKGNHIITTGFEHGSIVAALNHLSNKGFSIDIVETDAFGRVDLEDLESLITDETILVSIGLVNSELGIVQDLQAIQALLKKYPQVIFHSDMTQAIGKVKLNYGLADIISLSAHKIYGFKGIGALLIREGISIEPLIHGGKSLSPLRGGTPPIGLIHSLGIAVHDAYHHMEENLLKVQSMHDDLLMQLKKVEGVSINSNQYSLPHIVNISFNRGKGIDVQKYLSDHGIFVSTTSACSSGEGISRVVMALTHDQAKASSSLRISLSHLTLKEDIDQFVECLEAYHEGC